MALKYGSIGIIISLLFITLLCQIRDCSFIMTSQAPINDITDMYASTVWVSFNTGDESYRGTGWVFKNDKAIGVSYIMTAAHVINQKEIGELNILYWPGHGGWRSAPATVMYKSSGRVAGDVAILVVPVIIEALPVGTTEDYKINDEVLLAGVQNQAPPAMVSVGFIIKINNLIDKVVVNGWSWRGHSGGPLVHRKSGKVIGFISRFATDDIKNGSATECSDLSTILDAITQAGLR